MQKRIRNWHTNWLITIGGVLFLLIGANTVLAADHAADPTRQRVTAFTAIDTSCELVSEGVTIVDDATGMSYITGEIYRGIVVSDHPIFNNATSYIVIDTEVNQELEETKVWVTTYLYPELVRGTLIAPGQGEVTTTGPNVMHSGYGTRELAGMRMRFTVRGAAEQDDLPCEPLIPAAELEGVLIDLGAPSE